MDIVINSLKGEKKYTMPDGWDDMPLGMYVKAMDTLTTDEDDIQQVVRLVNIMTGIPKKEIEKLTVPQLNELKDEIEILVGKEIDTELKHFIEIDGIEYGFHPNLSEISIGEFADIEHYLKEDINKNLHKVLSVLYRPVTKKEGDKYAIEDYKPSKERARLFYDNLKVSDFAGASAFFLSLGRELLTNTLESLVKRKKANKAKRLAMQIV